MQVPTFVSHMGLSPLEIQRKIGCETAGKQLGKGWNGMGFKVPSKPFWNIVIQGKLLVLFRRGNKRLLRCWVGMCLPPKLAILMKFLELISWMPCGVTNSLRKRKAGRVLLQTLLFSFSSWGCLSPAKGRNGRP